MNAFRTGAAVLLVAVLAAGATPAPVPQAVRKAEKELAAVKQKLCGSWHGDQCEGEYTFRADGTYDFACDGPLRLSHGGTWSLRGDPVKPTLVMQCQKGAKRDKAVELTVVSVGDKEFEFEPAPEETRIFYRAKPDTAPAPVGRNDK